MRFRRGFALWLDAGTWLVLLLLGLVIVWQGASQAVSVNARVSGQNAALATARWTADKLYSSCEPPTFPVVACVTNGASTPYALPGRFSALAQPTGIVFAGNTPLAKFDVHWELHALNTTSSISGTCMTRYGVQEGALNTPVALTVCADFQH